MLPPPPNSCPLNSIPQEKNIFHYQNPIWMICGFNETW